MARWADLFDDELIVVDCVVRSGTKTTRVAMQPEDTVGDLCDWLERTEDLPHDSLVLSQDSNFLKRDQQTQSLQGRRTCVLLQLVGRPCSLRKDKEKCLPLSSGQRRSNGTSESRRSPIRRRPARTAAFWPPAEWARLQRSLPCFWVPTTEFLTQFTCFLQASTSTALGSQSRSARAAWRAAASTTSGTIRR